MCFVCAKQQKVMKLQKDKIFNYDDVIKNDLLIVKVLKYETLSKLIAACLVLGFLSFVEDFNKYEKGKTLFFKCNRLIITSDHLTTKLKICRAYTC